MAAQNGKDLLIKVDMDDAGTFETLAGLRASRISFNTERARQIFFDGHIPNFQVVIPDFGIVEGAFQITSLEYAGNYDGEATYEMSFSSAGSLAFSAI